MKDTGQRPDQHTARPGSGMCPTTQKAEVDQIKANLGNITELCPINEIYQKLPAQLRPHY